MNAQYPDAVSLSTMDAQSYIDNASPTTELIPMKRSASVPILSLWGFATAKERILILFAMLGSLVSGIINPLAIFYLGDLLRALLTQTIANSDAGALIFKAKQFAALGAGAFAATYLARSLWVFTCERQIHRISLLYLEGVLTKDMGWLDTAQGESLAGRLGNDIPLIKNGIGENTGSIFAVLGTMAATLAISFSANWKLTMIILSLLPLLIIVGIAIVKVNSIMVTRSGDAFARASALAEQALGGVRTVYAFSLQSRLQDKYSKALHGVESADRKKSNIAGFALGFFTSLLFLIFALSFYLAVRMKIDGDIDGSSAVTVLLSMMMLAASLMNVPSALSVLASAAAAASILFHIIWDAQSMAPGARGAQEMRTLDRISGKISFQNVHFSYPARPEIPILNDLHLEIGAGKTVAFVGGSGSGKSTTIALLQRLYNPARGFVLVDGKDVRSLDPQWLRRHIGVVGQEPVLFALSIKQNILLGTHESVSTSRFLEVCKMSQCHEFVSKLPLGYDTPVTTGMLSGGQKQRIAIARALISDPKILLLDEATSALDTNSERLVQKALDSASSGRTTIVIAHRLSTVRNADMICVMEKGVLIEKGRHEELYALNGTYTQLVNKQKLSVGHETAPGRDEPMVSQRESVQMERNEYIIEIMRADEELHMDSPEELAAQSERRLQEERRRRGDVVHGSSSLFWRVFNFMRPEWTLIVLGTLAAGCGGVVFPGFALILGFTVQEIVKPDPTTAYRWISFMLVVVAFALFSTWARSALFGRVNAIVTTKLRLLMLQNLLKQEMGFFDLKLNSIGILCNKLAMCSSVPCFVTEVWSELAQLSFTAIYGIGLSMAFAPTLAAILLILLPFLIIASYWQSSAISLYADASKEANEQAMQVATEAIRDVKTFKSLVREDFAVQRYRTFLAKPFELSRKNAFLDSLAYAVQATAAMFTISLGLYAGSRLIKSATLELWQLLVVVLGMMVTMISVASSAGLASAYAKGKFASLTAFQLLDRETEIDPEKNGFVPTNFRAGFKFENLAFQYPTSTEPIFTGQFNLEGLEDKSLALVGPSGCGKSTVIGLLQRWYEAQAGEGTIGGVRIADYQLLQGLRSNIALVGQEPILFDMSIADNIAWGCERPVTMDEIIDAAKQANVDGFVAALPDGYNTRVGEKGGRLSGGQKQRIAIARALIRKPKLLLLDEATSALDSTSEAEVQKAIDKAAVGRTTVTIAHRLSTIRNVDCIAVVSGGKIVEMGRHEQLVALNGVYAGLCRQQDV